MKDEQEFWDELFGQQHDQTEFSRQSPDYAQHGFTLSENDPDYFGRSADIDLVEESEDWIKGFDAGFASRPFACGNTEEYHKGYLDGQHEWLDQATSPATASVFTNTSSPAPLDADLIDPQLVALDASNDDPFTTPTQFIQPVSSHENDPAHNNSDLTTLFLDGSAQQHVQLSSPAIPRLRVTPVGGTDFHANGLDFSIPSAPSTWHAPKSVNQFKTPTKGRAVRRQIPDSARFALSQRLSPLIEKQHSFPMSPDVRRSLSEANAAWFASSVLSSQGDASAAAIAAAKATTWEKKARRRQSKNYSQSKIRARRRANPARRA